MAVFKIPFKIEKRNNIPVGYPYLSWWFQGIKYEGLIDTGADNIVGGLDFLKFLDSINFVSIEEIYQKNQLRVSSGIGGSMWTTHPIQMPIEVRLKADVYRFDLGMSFCLPPNRQSYDTYCDGQLSIPQLEQRLGGTKDQRLLQKTSDQINQLKVAKMKFNPPVLFGKPFISKLNYITFCVKDESSNNGSYFELEPDPKFKV